MDANPIPQYMNQGSHGPHVNTWLQVAMNLGLLESAGVVCDGDYGSKAAEAATTVQVSHDLDIDGNLGPQTRAALREHYEFDFEATCLHVPGTTLFRQPDGTDVAWTSPAI